MHGLAARFVNNSVLIHTRTNVTRVTFLVCPPLPHEPLHTDMHKTYANKGAGCPPNTNILSWESLVFPNTKSILSRRRLATLRRRECTNPCWACAVRRKSRHRGSVLERGPHLSCLRACVYLLTSKPMTSTGGEEGGGHFGSDCPHQCGNG